MFYTEFRRILLVFQSIGLSPFGLNPKQNIILQVVSICLLLAASLILISLFLVTGYLPPDGLQLVISRLLLVAEIVTHFIVICQSYATREQQAQIWRNFDSVQELLDQAGYPTTNGTPGRKLFLKIWLMLGTIVGTMLIEAVFLYIF